MRSRTFFHGLKTPSGPELIIVEALRSQTDTHPHTHTLGITLLDE